jgi:hypothetical protein
MSLYLFYFQELTIVVIKVQQIQILTILIGVLLMVL